MLGRCGSLAGNSLKLKTFWYLLPHGGVGSIPQALRWQGLLGQTLAVEPWLGTASLLKFERPVVRLALAAAGAYHEVDSSTIAFKPR
jgi:hypothetical protein